MFKNKIAVVTGAGGTLCSEIAVELAAKGATVFLVGRTKEKLERTAEKITAAGGLAPIIFPYDVTDREAVDALAAEVEKVGGCDFLINGAGGNDVRAMPTITAYDPRELTGELPEGAKGLYNVDMDAFEWVLKLNTMGTVLPTMALGKQMIKKGGGSVINFASMNSYCPLTRCFAYAMSKAAIVNLTQSLAAYFAPANIRINAIAPGFILGKQNKALLYNEDGTLTPRSGKILGGTPMNRFVDAEELIGATLFLCDDVAASAITGVVLPVDGGFASYWGV